MAINAAPAMLASKIFFIPHPRGFSCTIAIKTKGVIGKSRHSDDNFGSVLYRCYTMKNPFTFNVGWQAIGDGVTICEGCIDKAVDAIAAQKHHDLAEPA
jgi:hypothetical protein